MYNPSLWRYAMVPALVMLVIVVGAAACQTPPTQENDLSAETGSESIVAEDEAADIPTDQDMESSESTTSVPAVQPNTETETSAADVTAFTVGVRNFSFDPTEIRVKKGERVKVTLVNNEGFHDFVVDEFNARTKQISANETASIEFTADRVGEFEYYCSVGNHRQRGMVGKLIVTE